MLKGATLIDMKIGVSRSRLVARVLDDKRVREQALRYLDRHGWDAVEDEAAWRRHQRRRMAQEYRNDKW